MSNVTHWESIYGAKAPNAVSWYRPHLDVSLRLIDDAGPDRSACILDVGGGESTLAEDLMSRGYRNTTVLDISLTALAVSRQRSSAHSGTIRWVCADVTRLPFAPDSFDVWHDRALFHFLTAPEDRAAYVEQLIRSVRPGGHVIVGTFGPEGPERCSGLNVIRYDAESLHAQFGGRFQFVDSVKEVHLTPWGAPQQFVYCYCRVG